MNNNYPTIQQYEDSDPYTHIIAAPSNYQLKNPGNWTYSAAYLVIHTATQAVVAEIFKDPGNITTGCNLSKATDNNGNLYCPTGGTNCESWTIGNSTAYCLCAS